MGQEQLCKGCAKCWGGYVGVGCMVSGQNTAMVSPLRAAACLRRSVRVLTCLCDAARSRSSDRGSSRRTCARMASTAGCAERMEEGL
eukprot:3743041-Rhodomonas_salina.1